LETRHRTAHVEYESDTWVHAFELTWCATPASHTSHMSICMYGCG
jgi:hypothetical protein